MTELSSAAAAVAVGTTGFKAPGTTPPKTPRGYTRDPTTRKLAPDADADSVRQAFADRIAGKPMSVIGRDLGMTASGARALLHNRVYLGELRVGAHVNPSAHPPLVDGDTFDAAERARVTRPTRKGGHPSILSGVVRCAGCGHVMSRANTKVLVYTCHVNHSDGRCPAPAAITARLLEDHVVAIALVRLAALRSHAMHDGQPLAQARQALDAASRELGAFLRGVVAAGLAPEQFADAARDRREAVEAAHEHVASLLGEQLPATIAGDPVTTWGLLNDTQRNRLLCSLVEVVLVARAGGRGRIVPIATRVRVIVRGAGVVDTKRFRGAARPIVAVALPDLDDPRVLGMDLAEDEL